MKRSTSALVGHARAAAHLARRGLTLVEIMVVIAILGLLMSVIAFNVVASADEADVEACRLQIQTIEAKLGQYYASAQPKGYPDTSAGLEKIAKLFPNSEVPVDPWGNAYQYTSDGTDYEIVSLGKDGAQGGEDVNADISSKDDQAAE